MPMQGLGTHRQKFYIIGYRQCNLNVSVFNFSIISVPTECSAVQLLNKEGLKEALDGNKDDSQTAMGLTLTSMFAHHMASGALLCGGLRSNQKSLFIRPTTTATSNSDRYLEHC